MSNSKAVFTLYQTVNGTLRKVYQVGRLFTLRTLLSEHFFSEQDCSAPLFRVEHSVLDRFLNCPTQV